MTVDGKAREAIANEMIRLYAEYYGRGPTKAKVYSEGTFLAVVLEETFTPAEKTLIDRGEGEGIQDIRRRFQRAMEEQFTAVVEQNTGRRVRAFLSDTNLQEDISVEFFILAAPRTDMSDFEDAQGSSAGTADWCEPVTGYVADERHAVAVGCVLGEDGQAAALGAGVPAGAPRHGELRQAGERGIRERVGTGPDTSRRGR
jgi:uncharacterized protein YbcI